MRRALVVLLAALALLASAGPAGAATPAAAEARVLVLVNRARAAAGCPALRADPRLHLAALRHSRDMARRRYVAHVSPGGSTPWARIARTGYRAPALAENIAAGQPTADAVVRAWLASPPHRRNILDCRMRAAGTGLALGGPYRTYWTQDLGSR